MRFKAGSLRGLLRFDSVNSPLSWKPQGAAKPLSLSMAGGAHVERSSRNADKGVLSFDAEAFHQVKHLHSDEVIPCRGLSYDEESVDFRSPFLEMRTLKASHLKAIEFNVASLKANIDQLLGRASTVNKLTIDQAKLGRALTVPRFNRDSPPSHVLVANSGDLRKPCYREPWP